MYCTFYTCSYTHSHVYAYIYIYIYCTHPCYSASGRLTLMNSALTHMCVCVCDIIFKCIVYHTIHIRHINNCTLHGTILGSWTEVYSFVSPPKHDHALQPALRTGRGKSVLVQEGPRRGCDFDTLLISVYRIVYGLHHYLFAQIHHTIRLQQNQSHVMSVCYKDCNCMMHA